MRTFDIEILDDAYGGWIEYPDYDNQWDEGHSFVNHNIRGFRIVKKNDYHDLTVDFPPKKNKVYYLLYITYDTGSSFGIEDGEIAFVDLYQKRSSAQENEKRLLNHYRNSKDEYSTKLIAENGKEYDYSVPGTGYFDKNVSVSIEQIELKKD